MMTTPWRETTDRARQQYEEIANNPNDDDTEALRGLAITLFGVTNALTRKIQLTEQGKRKYQLKMLEEMRARELGLVKIEPGLEKLKIKTEPALEKLEIKTEPGLEKLKIKTEPGLEKLKIKTEPGTSASTLDPEARMTEVKVKVECKDETGTGPLNVGDDIKIKKEEEEEKPNKGKPRRSRRKRGSKK